MKDIRYRQDLNLCGQSPIDFKSISLNHSDTIPLLKISIPTPGLEPGSAG